MKYYSRANVYKASNVLFSPERIMATSYDWWTFVKVIGDKTVFNEYPYSNTTRRHQSKVRSLMRDLGFNIDLTIQTPKSLSDGHALRSAYEFYSEKIAVLETKIKTPRTRKAKNYERMGQISDLSKQRDAVQRLMEQVS